MKKQKVIDSIDLAEHLDKGWTIFSEYNHAGIQSGYIIEKELIERELVTNTIISTLHKFNKLDSQIVKLLNAEEYCHENGIIYNIKDNPVPSLDKKFITELIEYIYNLELTCGSRNPKFINTLQNGVEANKKQPE